LLCDGEIAAACEEERFSRVKGDDSFPQQSISYALEKANIEPNHLDLVVYYDKPLLTFSRLVQSYIEFPLKSFLSFRKSIPLWANQKLKIPKIIRENLNRYDGPICFSKHHESHAASSFFCSPFREAALIVSDGVGEWACSSIGHGVENSLRILKECHFPHSLGLFYSTITQYLGFKVNEDEYKIMGLAPYGEPKYADRILTNLVDLKPDGSLALNLDYFRFPYGLSMFSDKLELLFQEKPRNKQDPLKSFHMDLAASVQNVTNEVMLRLASTAKNLTGAENLCLAGGVALNGVSNGKILQKGLFKNIYIQPAAGDAGGAIGAALQGWHEYFGEKRAVGIDRMKGALLGPAVNVSKAKIFFQSCGQKYQEVEFAKIPKLAARWIASGKVVGWCQGRMEFGPRALGARSILGDARNPETQTKMNLKIKFRESFRPFAPAVLEEEAGSIFELTQKSPYMLLIVPLKEKLRKNKENNRRIKGLKKLKVVRSIYPAVTHVDYSARPQTVGNDSEPMFRSLVEEFYKNTGCPMIVNTSFNVQGEPIVCDHKDALRCFRMSQIDILIYGNLVLKK